MKDSFKSLFLEFDVICSTTSVLIVIQQSWDTKLRYGNLLSTLSGKYLPAKNLIRVLYIFIFIGVDTMAPRF